MIVSVHSMIKKIPTAYIIAWTLDKPFLFSLMSVMSEASIVPLEHALYKPYNPHAKSMRIKLSKKAQTKNERLKKHQRQGISFYGSSNPLKHRLGIQPLARKS